MNIVLLQTSRLLVALDFSCWWWNHTYYHAWATHVWDLGWLTVTWRGEMRPFRPKPWPRGQKDPFGAPRQGPE